MYGKSDEEIRAKGYYPSIDNVAIEGILFTMDEYDNAGRIVSLYNKRTDTKIEIETSDRYKSWKDAEVSVFENYGACRNDINYLD